LILDGHTTRLQSDVWETFQSKNVDVLVIPSHTSQLTQPLDLNVNGLFKDNLTLIKTLPKKTKMNTELQNFIKTLIDCVYVSLTRAAIRRGFYLARLTNNENNFEKLKEEIYTFLNTLPTSCHLGVFFFVLFLNIKKIKI
jgi:hypothetical protein